MHAFHKLAVAGIALTGLLAAAGLVVADDKAGEKKEPEQQLVGQVVDSRCYVKMGATGGDHAECAVQCLKDGIPAALLVDGGKEVYYIVAPAMGFADYANKTVRLTGKVDEKAHAIAPTRLEVKKGDTWTEGKLPKSMM